VANRRRETSPWRARRRTWAFPHGHLSFGFLPRWLIAIGFDLHVHRDTASFALQVPMLHFEARWWRR
jgi:hypothetical protein